MDKILITGANGQLGRCIRDIAPFYPQYEFVYTDVAELDITDRQAVLSYVSELKPLWMVNTAAYTAVDKAEEEPQKALALNSTAVANLVAAARSIEASFIHISTDYVFAGDKNDPLVETDPCNPISVYGSTKLEGENEALSYNKSTVLRTSWLYSEYGKNFVKTMLNLSTRTDKVRVVADQWGTPTSAHDLAKAVMTVIQNPNYGLYHFSNEGLTCWALFAEEIFAQAGLKTEVEHITTDQFPVTAHRPAFSILSKKKFHTTFKVDIPEWEESLPEIIHKLVADIKEK